MSIRNIITEKIILPLSDIVLGQSVNKHFKFLMKSQYWSEAELKDYQNKKLRTLIKHAYENVPYYMEIFKKLKLNPKDIKTTSDLYKLPILTKEIVRENFKNGKIIAKNTPKNQIILSVSSGSTGEPMQYYLTKDAYSINLAANIRGWYWMKYRLGDKYIKLSMNSRSSLIKNLQDKINNCSYLFSRQLVKPNFEQILDEIIKIKPKFLRCYPVPLYFLAQIIKEKNLHIDFIKAINTTGSTLHNDMREFIEKIFNTRVYDSYSCEGGANVSQCYEGYYHSSEDYAISEFIEDNYSKSSEHNTYRLITTDLYNYVVPFIRYDTQDYLVLGDDNKCKCGRELLKINSIKGRDSDILITPANKYLIVENFVAYFEWIESVNQIQIVQDKIDEIQINLMVNKLFNKNEESKILQYWKEYIGDDVRLFINVVDEIKLSSSGKRRTLIRNSNIKLNF